MASSSIKQKSLLTTRDIAAVANVPGNSNACITIPVPSISGYTYLGIIGIKNSHGANFPITDFSAGEHRIVVRNLTGTAAEVTLTARLLFVSTTAKS